MQAGEHSDPGCVGGLKRYFVNLRFITTLMCIWLGIVLCILTELGIFANSKFVAFGPRPELSFMHVPIDTYYKYNMLITMIVLHTFVTDVIADSLGPHVLNVVQDPKTVYIPHSSFTYVSITTVWSFYCSISQLFVIFIAFAQLDLLVVRLLSDVAANFVTMSMYLHGKTHDPSMYSRLFNTDTADHCDDEISSGSDTAPPTMRHRHQPDATPPRESISRRESVLLVPLRLLRSMQQTLTQRRRRGKAAAAATAAPRSHTVVCCEEDDDDEYFGRDVAPLPANRSPARSSAGSSVSVGSAGGMYTPPQPTPPRPPTAAASPPSPRLPVDDDDEHAAAAPPA